MKRDTSLIRKSYQKKVKCKQLQAHGRDLAKDWWASRQIQRGSCGIFLLSLQCGQCSIVGVASYFVSVDSILSYVFSDSGNSQPYIWHCELPCLEPMSSFLHKYFIEKLGEFITQRWTGYHFKRPGSCFKECLSPLHISLSLCFTYTWGPTLRSLSPWALRVFLFYYHHPRSQNTYLYVKATF